MDLAVRTIEIGGFVSAFTAMRLPFNSAKKSDSVGSVSAMNPISYSEFRIDHTYNFEIGESDLQLAQKLILNGDEHAKFIRGVVVWCSIDAPRYWWQEMDTYRAGHERLSSQSTMHVEAKGLSGLELQQVKSNLPEGTHQTRIDYFSYQTLRRIYFQRRNHRLPEWQQFCAWIESLPYAYLLITLERNNDNILSQ